MVLLIRGKKNSDSHENRWGRTCDPLRNGRAMTFRKNSIPPPPDWEPVFDALAKECNSGQELHTGFDAVRAI